MITIDLPSSPQPFHPVPSKPALTRFLNRARAIIGLPGTVDVLLTTDAELKRLNRTFRGKNKPTDVLSFPPGPFPAPIPGPLIAHEHAGDLAISLDTAARQASSFGHPLETELRILLLHGLLHLAGLDHETDSGQMAARESELRSTLRLPTSLIARSLQPTSPEVLPKRPPPARTAGQNLRPVTPSSKQPRSANRRPSTPRRGKA